MNYLNLRKKEIERKIMFNNKTKQIISYLNGIRKIVILKMLIEIY